MQMSFEKRASPPAPAAADVWALLQGKRPWSVEYCCRAAAIAFTFARVTAIIVRRLAEARPPRMSVARIAMMQTTTWSSRSVKPEDLRADGGARMGPHLSPRRDYCWNDGSGRLPGRP